MIVNDSQFFDLACQTLANSCLYLICVLVYRFGIYIHVCVYQHPKECVDPCMWSSWQMLGGLLGRELVTSITVNSFYLQCMESTYSFSLFLYLFQPNLYKGIIHFCYWIYLRSVHPIFVLYLLAKILVVLSMATKSIYEIFVSIFCWCDFLWILSTLYTNNNNINDDDDDDGIENLCRWITLF